MSPSLLIILAIAVIVFIAVYKVNQKKSTKNYTTNGIPFGMEGQYDLALNPGVDGKALLYDLTTCSHCIKVHNYLEKHNIDHHDVPVDHFIGEARKQVLAKLKTYNPKASFPTLVFPDGKVVIGYKENALQDAINAQEK